MGCSHSNVIEVDKAGTKLENVKLIYFPIHGRAEVIRLALHYAKIEFENVEWTNEEFGKNRGKTPYSQLPVLEIAGKQYSQTRSILRLICQHAGLYPNNITDIFATESLTDAYFDLFDSIAGAAFSENKEAAFAKLFGTTVPEKLPMIEKQFLLYSHDKLHVVGNKNSPADICLANLYLILTSDSMKDSTKKALDSVPELKKYMESKVKDFENYVSKRPKKNF